jgi:hypothetical protein
VDVGPILKVFDALIEEWLLAVDYSKLPDTQSDSTNVDTSRKSGVYVNDALRVGRGDRFLSDRRWS